MESGEHQVCGGGGQREEERCRAGGRHPWQSAAAVPSRPPTGTMPVHRPAEVFAAPPNLPAPGGCPSAVGALCELTHFVTVPEQRRLFINARVVGRFETQQVVSDKPFVTGGQVGGASPCAFAGQAGCRQWCAACLLPLQWRACCSLWADPAACLLGKSRLQCQPATPCLQPVRPALETGAAPDASPLALLLLHSNLMRLLQYSRGRTGMNRPRIWRRSCSCVPSR